MTGTYEIKNRGLIIVIFSTIYFIIIIILNVYVTEIILVLVKELY